MTAMPAPPLSRFVPAIAELESRRGITVAVDRQPNFCRWAVHTLSAQGYSLTVAGPRPDQAANPSNTDLAAQISEAVKALSPELAPVYTSDWDTAQLLRRKTALPISDLAAPVEALHAARDAIQAVELRAITGLVLACDSSRGRGTDINGCGWVLQYANGADPVIGTSTAVSTHGGIRAGELAAIRKGLRASLRLHPALGEGLGDVTILSDSRAALGLLERVIGGGPAKPGDDSDSLLEARKTAELIRGMKVAFQWVRGHDGNPMNELADRLAVLARRNREMDVDEITHARMVASVRADARATCDSLRQEA